MKKFFNPLLLSCFIIVACSSVKILKTDQADGFSLKNYKTFDFVPVTLTGEVSPSFNQRAEWIKTEVAKQLTNRGLTQVSSNPDLLVNIGVVVEEKTQTRETTIRDTPPTYIGQRNYTWQSQEVPVGTYKEGTVTVELVDQVKKEMVWEGVASSVIMKKDEASQKNIADGAELLFSKID